MSDQARDELGRFAGNGSHSVALPSKKSKLTIQHAALALQSMGLTLGKSSFDPSKKQMSYELTGPNGKRSVNTDDLKTLLYARVAASAIRKKA